MFGKAFKATFGVGCAIVVGIIALAIIGGALASSSASKPTTPPLGVTTTAAAAPTAAGAGTWTVIKQWSGNGAKDTETFTVGGEWRVDWINSGSYLGVTIYDASTKFPIGLAANTQAQTSDSSFQHKAGTYYLSVNAVGPWKLAVQDLR